MEELKINVYDDKDQVIKTCKAQVVDIRFGEIAAIMDLVDVDNLENNVQLLQTIHRAWKQLRKVLGKIFPDMEAEDWENVSMKELIPVVIGIIKYSFAEMMNIPKSKNE